ncbi:MAG: porin [Caldimonas sp.]
MIRSLCTAAVAAAALTSGAGAAAQSAVLYGLLDASASRVRPVGIDTRSLQLDSGNMARSYFGLRGIEDLGGGLRAVFKLESYIRVDVGAAGRADGDAFWAREASVGLLGSFGSTVLGRTPSPLWLSTINFNPFGESIGFSPAVRQYFGGAVLGDTRWNNSIWYTNNPRDPLRVVFSANADETTPGDSNGHNLGLSISYITGPFAATVVAERVRNSGQALPPGFQRQVILQAGATYDFQFVRLYGLVGRIKTEANEDVRNTSFQLGAAVPIGTGVILVAYGRAHDSRPSRATTDRTASIGYDHFLSKRTDIYVAAMYEKLSFVSSGNAIAGGLRVRF